MAVLTQVVSTLEHLPRQRTVIMQATLFTDNRIKVEAQGGALLVYTPWNPQFVEQLKIDIPASERKWDAARKVWAVSPKRANLLRALIREYYRVTHSSFGASCPMIQLVTSTRPRASTLSSHWRIASTTNLPTISLPRARINPHRSGDR